jgi:septal ring factor EnvC (AmiA/AmiB activator)
MRTLSALLAVTAWQSGDASTANPIRKVVTMMQALQAKVEAEGEKEKELYDKYMCYCKNAGGDLAKSIADAEAKGPELQSAIEEGESKLAQMKEDIKNHQADRAAAKEAMAEATGVREKERAAFESATSDLKTNTAAMAKAIAAIEKGMGESFLQTTTASVLKKIIMNDSKIQDADRQDVMAFLTSNSDYAPASGEIVGILKQMSDEMNADLKEATDAEEAAVKSYDELMAAKTKEVNALTKMIEEKLERSGELAVEIQEMKNDLGDTAESLEEDKKFLADLDKNCAEKTKLFEENVKYRTQELAALADTIKILNDDDALELFKKTLPAPEASFLQVEVTTAQMRARALSMINLARRSTHRPELDFIALSLRGKKIGFEKVLKMIDDMVAQLKTEQKDDDEKKEYCADEFDKADDKKKVLEKGVEDLNTAIEDSKEGIQTTTADIAALKKGIKSLDKAVAEATEQRKEENEDYTQLMASDAAAKELLEFAKNRLNKFYNPKLYKPPAKEETAFAQREAPPPPPEDIKAYSKKSEESNGIIAMIDTLIRDLEKEMTEAELTEKDAQEDYETFMKDSADKRAQDSKTLTDKEGALADLEAGLGEQKANLESTTKELAATNDYIANLHLECDFLLKYYDMRKEARTNEIDAMEKAKAVLNGADYSLIQTSVRARKFLRH